MSDPTFSRNHAIGTGIAGGSPALVGVSPNRMSAPINHETVRHFCAQEPSAGRRWQRPGRSRSPATSASLRLRWLLILVLVGGPGVRAATPPPGDIRRDATVEAVQRVLPAVVNIRTETIVERQD